MAITRPSRRLAESLSSSLLSYHLWCCQRAWAISWICLARGAFQLVAWKITRDRQPLSLPAQWRLRVFVIYLVAFFRPKSNQSLKSILMYCNFMFVCRFYEEQPRVIILSTSAPSVELKRLLTNPFYHKFTVRKKAMWFFFFFWFFFKIFISFEQKKVLFARLGTE